MQKQTIVIFEIIELKLEKRLDTEKLKVKVRLIAV